MDDNAVLALPPPLPVRTRGGIKFRHEFKAFSCPLSFPLYFACFPLLLEGSRDFKIISLCFSSNGGRFFFFFVFSFFPPREMIFWNFWISMDFIAFIFVTGFVTFFFFFFGVSRIGRLLFLRYQTTHLCANIFPSFFFPPIYLHMFFRMKMIGHRKLWEQVARGSTLCWNDFYFNFSGNRYFVRNAMLFLNNILKYEFELVPIKIRYINIFVIFFCRDRSHFLRKFVFENFHPSRTNIRIGSIFRVITLLFSMLFR